MIVLNRGITMKRCVVYLTVLLALVISSSCSNDTLNKSQNNDGTEVIEKTDTKSTQAERESGISFSLGDFESIKVKKDIGSFESGPISFSVESVSVYRGKLDPIYTQGVLPEDEIELVTFILYISSENQDIVFDEEHFELTTDSGEVFNEPNGSLSSAVYPLVLSSKERYTNVTYLLEKSKGEDIKRVKFRVKAPMDKSGQPLGENINIDIDLSNKTH
jgi:hypothetical protein